MKLHLFLAKLPKVFIAQQQYFSFWTLLHVPWWHFKSYLFYMKSIEHTIFFINLYRTPTSCLSNFLESGTAFSDFSAVHQLSSIIWHRYIYLNVQNCNNQNKVHVLVKNRFHMPFLFCFTYSILNTNIR